MPFKKWKKKNDHVLQAFVLNEAFGNQLGIIGTYVTLLLYLMLTYYFQHSTKVDWLFTIECLWILIFSNQCKK